MFHYLFTNDLRISNLDIALQKAGENFINETIPTNKAENNNTMTLGFYFNLTKNSNCAKAAANNEIRKVVLNFIKKFQFPNLRTSRSFTDAKNDAILIAPMRAVLKSLYIIYLSDGENGYLTRDEIKDFIFYNRVIAKTKLKDFLKLYTDIKKYRETGELPSSVEQSEDNRIWNQEDRQLREMIKVLLWADCVEEIERDKYRFKDQGLDKDSKAEIFDIITYDKYWEGDSLQDYQSYMDLSENELSDNTNDGQCNNNNIIVDKLSFYTPEWFKSKSTEEQFKNVDQQAENLTHNFMNMFSPEKLSILEGKEVITTMFLNNENGKNLCHELEYNKDNIFYFGSIRNGTAFKYGLHYSPKKQSWMTGTHLNPEMLTEEEAIILGTKIRDALLKGYEVIKNTKQLETIDDYLDLYQRLDLQTDGYINKIWFMKYYFIMFPNVFSNFYSQQAQTNALKILDKSPNENSLGRTGQLVEFIKLCGISTVLFSRIFHTYCNNDIEQVEEVEKMKNCLEIKRDIRKNVIHPLNFIVYGAPGTGKTYSTAEYALSIIENREVDLREKNVEERKSIMASYENYIKKGQIVFTTFHQNYGYEDFIQGLRPDTSKDEMSFKIVDGVFKKIADKALADNDNNYVIIIDEINRANISKVFGELITLIEDDKRWGEVNEACATLQSGDIFAVPNNLYIVGTMNSADKSISLIDTALRRRFEFIEQKPNSKLVKDEILKIILDRLNDKLVVELDSTDLLIGHSYFMNKTSEDLCKILNNSIIPLLYEYFYDNRKKVYNILKDVIKDVDIEIVDAKVGRICVRKQG